LVRLTGLDVMEKSNVFTRFMFVFCVLMTGALAGSSANAAVLVVDDDLACAGAVYTTIQPALTAAMSGDTVEVCDGTYTPSAQLTINKSLTLKSRNGAATTFIASTYQGENIIFISGGVSDVTVEGLDISDPTRNTQNFESSGVVTGGGVSNITIRDNVIHNIRDASVGDCQSNGSTGIVVNPVNGVSITGNVIRDLDNDGCTARFRVLSRAIFVSGGNAAAGDVTISGNAISNVRGNRAIGINVVKMTSSTLKIENNTIDSVVDSLSFRGSIGIELDGVTTTLDPAGNIVGNTINGVSNGVRLGGSNNVNVTGNTFTNLIAGFFGFPAPLNGDVDSLGTGNFMCGNADDPLATYAAFPVTINDVVFPTVGNEFPGGSAFEGNTDCAPTGPTCAVITGNSVIDEACCVDSDTLVYEDPETGRSNHGAYVSCVAHKVIELRMAGEIDKPTGKAFVSVAGQSSVNKPN